MHMRQGESGRRKRAARAEDIPASCVRRRRRSYGAHFIIFKGFSTEGQPAGDSGHAGHFGWHELMAGDREARSRSTQSSRLVQGRGGSRAPAGLYQTFATATRRSAA